MKFNTAICFVAAGITLFLLDTSPVNRSRKLVAYVAAWFILITGTLHLFEYLFEYNLGIDELLWKDDPGAAKTYYPGRMSVSTAVNFIMLGFIFLTVHLPKFRWLVQTLLIFIIAGAVPVLLNYLFGGSFLNDIPQISNTALHTAVLFILLCTGIFRSAPLRNIKFSFQKKIAGVFALTVFILVIIFFAVKKNSSRMADTGRWVDHTNQVIFKAELIRAELAEIQSGIRGFLITGKEDYLPLFNNSAVTIDKNIRQLQTLTKDNPLQQNQVTLLEKFVNGYIQSRRELISRYKTGPLSGKEIKLATDEGKIVVDQARGLVLAIQQHENALLATRKEENERSVVNSERIITVFQVIAVLMLLTGLAVIFYNIKARDRAESIIKQTSAQVHDLYNKAPCGYHSLSQSGVILNMNDTELNWLGYQLEEVVGIMHFNDIITPESKEKFLDEFPKFKKTGYINDLEFDLIRKDGTIFPVIVSATAVYDEQGNYVHSRSTVFDNTERKQREAEIRAAHKRFSTIFNISPVPICISTIEKGVFLYANDAYYRLFGFTHEQIIGKRSLELDIIDAAEREKIKQGIMLADKGLRDVELKMKKSNGEPVDVLYSMEKVEIDGTPCMATYLIDITERKKAEQQIKVLNETLEKRVEEKTKEVIEKEQQYRFLLQNMREGIQVISHDWRYLFMNNSVVGQSKYSNEELLGYTMMEKYPGIEKTELFKTLQLCMTDRVPRVIENEFTFPDGSSGWFELSIQPVPEGLFILSMDITTRKKAEQESKRLLDSLQRSLNEIYMFNPDTLLFQYVNEGALKNLGYSVEEIKKLTPLDLKPEYTEQDFRSLVSPLVTDEKEKIVFFTHHRRKNGSLYPVEVHLQLIKQETQKLFLAVILDITERKKAEEEIKKSESRFKALIENNADGISLLNTATEVIYQSPGAERITGFTIKDRKNRTGFENIHPEDLEYAKKLFTEIIQNPGKSVPMLLRSLRNDGQYIWMEGTVTNLLQEESVKAIVINFRDVTHRIESEEQLRKYANDLQASNTELERFAHVASHDLQEPLRMVSSFLGLIQKKYTDHLDDAGRSYIRFAVDGAERMKKLILDLLLFSRVDSHKEPMQKVDCNQLIDDVQLDLQESILENNATIETMPLPVVTGYKSQLRQVFQNLISNAIKYRNEKPPFIQISCEDADTHWEFCVKDNGMGIDPKYFEKIFIIFQRLHNKDHFSGTGIGLTIAQKIVKRHGGKIWVQSQTGSGSTFCFTILKNQIIQS